jgi:hypothetical protein
LRAWAWLAGAVALAAPLGALTLQPKVVAAQAPVVIQKVTRRVVVVGGKAGAQSKIASGSSAGTALTTTGGSAVPR